MKLKEISYETELIKIKNYNNKMYEEENGLFGLIKDPTATIPKEEENLDPYRRLIYKAGEKYEELKKDGIVQVIPRKFSDHQYILHLQTTPNIYRRGDILYYVSSIAYNEPVQSVKIKEIISQDSDLYYLIETIEVDDNTPSKVGFAEESQLFVDLKSAEKFRESILERKRQQLREKFGKKEDFIHFIKERANLNSLELKVLKEILEKEWRAEK